MPTDPLLCSAWNLQAPPFQQSGPVAALSAHMLASIWVKSLYAVAWPLISRDNSNCLPSKASVRLLAYCHIQHSMPQWARQQSPPLAICETIRDSWLKRIEHVYLIIVTRKEVLQVSQSQVQVLSGADLLLVKQQRLACRQQQPLCRPVPLSAPLRKQQAASVLMSPPIQQERVPMLLL